MSTPIPVSDIRTFQISKVLALRGPNLWSTQTLIECWVEVWPRQRISPLWRETLRSWLPDFAPPAGDDLTRGALAFLLQQLCLHLQNGTSTQMTYGRVLPMDDTNVYRIIFQYDEETVGREALVLAEKILEAAWRGDPMDVAAAREALNELANDVCLGPSTRSMVNAALAAGIPVNRLTEGSLVQLGYGSQQRKILAAATSYTSAIAEDIVQDKDLTRRLLHEVGLPVPAGRPVVSAEDAWAAAQEIGLPVVVKPRDGNQGRGVAVNLFTREQVMAAYEAAREESSAVITEQFAEGLDYRLLVVGRQLVAAARRLPAHVIGDGVHSITELIAIENKDPRRASDHAAALSKIRIDQVALSVLHEQEVTPETVPAKDRTIYIRRNANLSTGGTAVDVTDDVHPTIREAMVEAAQTVGLDICGIDLVAHDVSQPLGKGNGSIIELNARPGLRMHLFPSEGKPRPVGEAVIEMMFPPGDQGRIPLVAVTGVNGKTTTTRFTAHLLEQVGHRVGFTSTDGIFVGKRKLDDGDCSGPKSARLVLAHPLVDAAVLETARGGILREGLAFDRCDVAIVTNIGEGDHLGLGGIDTVEKLADVKSCLLQTVSPTGCAVLNAADPLVVAMAMEDPRQTIFFALDGQNPIIQRHREAGGRAVYTQGGNIIRAEGEWEMTLIALTDVPLTHGGRVGFQVENTLAAIAAAWALGIADDLVRQGCRSFQPTLEQNAGRFNTLELRGLTVIVDYGHNPSALRKLLEAVENYPQTHRVSVYSAPGDRRNEDILEQGKMLASAFDEVWLYEGDYCRGREPGEIMGLLAQGLSNAKSATRVKRLEKITGALKALDQAIAAAPVGSLLVVQADTADETVTHLQTVYGAK